MGSGFAQPEGGPGGVRGRWRGEELLSRCRPGCGPGGVASLAVLRGAVVLSEAGVVPAPPWPGHLAPARKTTSSSQSTRVMLIAKAVETAPDWASSTRFSVEEGAMSLRESSAGGWGRLVCSCFVGVLGLGLIGAATGITVRVPGDEPTIQAGINAAAEGDTVLVAPGTYVGEGNRELALLGKNIVLRAALGNAATIVDCEQQGRGLHVRGSEPATARIVGFTVINGNARLGGGAYFAGGTNVVIERCRFVNNTSGDKGGGATIEGESSPTFLNCEFSDNYAGGQGGGIQFSEDSQVGSGSFRNCIIARNSARSQGGGAFVWGERATPTFVNCTIADNKARGAGLGAGFYIVQGASVTMNSCILRNIGSTEVELVNGGSLAATYSNISGGWGGAGNIDANPRFSTYRMFEFALRRVSPCIDTGDPSMEDGGDWFHPFLPPLYHQSNTSACDMGVYGGPDNVGWVP